MKTKANWQLMSIKDRAKFINKHGKTAVERLSNIKLKEIQQIVYSFLPVRPAKAPTKKNKEWRENRRLLKASRIPRDQWVRSVAPNKPRSRVML